MNAIQIFEHLQAQEIPASLFLKRVGVILVKINAHWFSAAYGTIGEKFVIITYTTD